MQNDYHSEKLQKQTDTQPKLPDCKQSIIHNATPTMTPSCGSSVVLKYAIKSTPLKSVYEAAFDIARSAPDTNHVDMSSQTCILVHRQRNVEPIVASLFNLPRVIGYVEKWSIDNLHVEEVAKEPTKLRFSIEASLTLGACTLSASTHYETKQKHEQQEKQKKTEQQEQQEEQQENLKQEQKSLNKQQQELQEISNTLQDIDVTCHISMEGLPSALLHLARPFIQREFDLQHNQIKKAIQSQVPGRET